MMIFILAAGDAERWGGECKQLKEVRGETVLGRTIEMLGDYASDRTVIVTHRSDIRNEFTSCLNPEVRNNLLCTVLSTSWLWNDHDEVLFLMGDVVWTRKALDKVLEPTDKSYQCYGSLDENFAFRFKGTMYDQVKDHISLILSKGLQGTTWELYRSVCGIPLDKDWTDRWFRTLILDKTDDIDYPEDYKAKIESGYYDDPEFDL